MLVSGQVLWKTGMTKIHFELSLKGIINTIFNPYIFSGAVVYVFATVIWLYLLSKEQLSKIYPLQSLCYVLGAVAGVIIFKESFSTSKVFGLILIVAGAFLVAAK